MHSSWAMMTKPRSLVIYTFSKKNYRPIFTQATNNTDAPLVPLSNLCVGGGGGLKNRYRYKSYDKSSCYCSWFLRSVCMGVVIGSSSGSFIAYADDSQQQFADAVDKKPVFLFGGTMHACIHF